MNWGLVSSGNPYRAPLARISRTPPEMGWSGGTGSGSSGGKGGSSSSQPATNAAVSALALLSFLFFLNMLQQQLSAGQQQTLLFMVNNSANGTRFNRRRRPLIAVASVQAKQGMNGRTKLTIKTMRNGKIKKRKQRDLEDVAEEKERKIQQVDQDFVEDHGGGTESESTEVEEEQPILMPGLPGADSLQLSAWLQGQLNVGDLQNDLVDTLTNCRAVVACTVHRTAKQTDLSATSIITEDVVRKLLGDAGEYAEHGHVDEACEDLLQAAGDECNLLAKSFSSLLPALDKNNNPAISHSNEPLHLLQNVNGDL